MARHRAALMYEVCSARVALLHSFRSLGEVHAALGAGWGKAATAWSDTPMSEKTARAFMVKVMRQNQDGFCEGEDGEGCRSRQRGIWVPSCIYVQAQVTTWSSSHQIRLPLFSIPTRSVLTNLEPRVLRNQNHQGVVRWYQISVADGSLELRPTCVSSRPTRSHVVVIRRNTCTDPKLLSIAVSPVSLLVGSRLGGTGGRTLCHLVQEAARREAVPSSCNSWPRHRV